MVMTEKYDDLFDNVIPNAIEGIKIFSKESEYLIEQNYDSITNREHELWEQLYSYVIDALNHYAAREYIEGFNALKIPSDRFPNFKKLSEKINPSSGWILTPVAGFLNEELFFTLTAQRQFPVTDIIRKSKRFEEKYAGKNIKNEEGYTPEPDIFHDVIGHSPLLMNKEYADLWQMMGEVGLELIRNERRLGNDLVTHNLKRLQNFAWWTYEFGIMEKLDFQNEKKFENEMNHVIYGSGILSSYDEIMNVVACSKGESSFSRILPFDMEKVVLTRFDYSDIQDRYYSIESFKKLFIDFEKDKELFFFEG